MDHGLSVDMLDDVDNTTKLLQVQEPVLSFFLQYQPSIIKTLHVSSVSSCKFSKTRQEDIIVFQCHKCSLYFNDHITSFFLDID